MATISDDPWTALASPRHTTAVTARRVDAVIKWDFYWALDAERRCMLLLSHSAAASPVGRLPRLRGVEVSLEVVAAAGKPCLVLKLLEPALRDIFYRLCIDILGSASETVSEAEAVATALARTWRWHHLLRGGISGLLSPEEQKGLIGELLVFERYLLAACPGSQALAAWRGPLGGAKDFVCGRTAVESKARSTSGAASVPISSEYQLDASGLDSLFLHLCVLDAEGPETGGGMTLTDVVRRIRERLTESEASLATRYDALLAAAGYRYEDDYSEMRWVGGERSVYRVRAEFPRITPGSVPAGVAQVEYMLSLTECGEFLVAPSALANALRAGSDDS